MCVWCGVELSLLVTLLNMLAFLACACTSVCVVCIAFGVCEWILCVNIPPLCMSCLVSVFKLYKMRTSKIRNSNITENLLILVVRDEDATSFSQKHKVNLAINFITNDINSPD